jgi:cardiolipin synthase
VSRPDSDRNNAAKRGDQAKSSVGRLIFAGIAVLLQILWILILFLRLNRYSSLISLLTSVLSAIIIVVLYNRRQNAAFKMVWMVLIAVLPIFGVTLFLMVEGSSALSYQRRRKQLVDKTLLSFAPPDDAESAKSLARLSPTISNQFSFLRNAGRNARCNAGSDSGKLDAVKFPVYQVGGSDVVFYAEAVDAFEAQKRDLRRAEHSIFMEYHAIQDAEAFVELHEILAERATAGVDVRVLYDDMGSFGFVNLDFINRMEVDGIRCRAFNPMKPIINVFMDNRDHRKITVIDGRISYTGGFNLADEYFNITHPYGYWKDTGVRISGEAAWTFTQMFLQLWHTSGKDKGSRADRVRLVDEAVRADGARYLVSHDARGASGPGASDADERCGFVLPYGVDPFAPERLGEDAYLNILKGAQKFAWFVSPYLIITDDMARELCLAAARGVDVRIVTPGIPDKKLIYAITRSYYPDLVRSGVRIFEYTPGFNHSKQVLVDDEAAIVGTANLDFRSLYHHFEDAVLMTGVSAIADIHADFDQLFDVSSEVTEQNLPHHALAYRLGMSLMRLFAPLL